MAVKNRFDWPSPAEATENSLQMRKQLEGEVAGFESHYGVPSACLRAEVEAGRIEETLDVCRWLIAIEALERLRSAG